MNKNNACAKYWNKYFKLDKEHFDAFEKYTSGKLKYSWFKKLMLGVFGGLFVGFGYTAYLLIAGLGDGSNDFWFSLIGALLFPVALLLCIYFGGSLFTSSCMGIISLIYKEHKVRHYVSDLALTLLGNAIGGIIFALIVWGSNLFGGAGSELTASGKHIIEIINGKIDDNHQWWNNFLSAIICNFIVVGTTILSITTKRNAIGVFIIYLMLVIFVIAGLQHVVANLYLFTIGGFLSLSETGDLAFTAQETGQLFYQNLIPALFGNLLGGIGLTMLFMSVQSYVCNRKAEKNKSNSPTKIEIKDN